MKNNSNLNIFSLKIKKGLNNFKQNFKPKLKAGKACTEYIKKINEIKLEDLMGFSQKKIQN